MSEQEYSWDVHIFKGEGRYAFQIFVGCCVLDKRDYFYHFFTV